MEVIKGKIVTSSAKSEPEPEKKIEYFTAPVPVRRHKLSFGAVVVVQIVLSAATGVFLWWITSQGGEGASIAEEILRRFLNG